jgi:hypothetical protein
MHTRLFRSSRAMFLGVAATLGLVVASSWPAPAQAPQHDPAAAGKEERPGPKTAPDGSAPTKSKGVPAAAPKGKMPPGAQILLQRRRAEVRELEAAWAAKRREVEQHLADILSDAKKETLKAAAEYQDRKLEREIAEIAVVEYEQGIYVQEFATAEGAIKLAESDLSRLEDRFDGTRRAFDKGIVSLEQKMSEELALKRARFTLEQAQSKRYVLEKYTKPKTLSELKARVAKARAEESSKQQAWELAKERERELMARSEQLHSPLTEAHIAALLTEAASLQAKVVQLLTRAQQSEKTEGLTAEQARLHAETVQKAIAQARSHEDTARSKLAEALELARLVQSWREELRDTEARLRKAREDLERLEKMMHEH